MRGTVLIAMTLLVSCPNLAVADNSHSTDLIERCRKSALVVGASTATKDFRVTDWQDAAFCSGYISGFVTGTYWSEGRRDYCIPDGVDTNQLIAIYASWADKHPETWHQPQAVTLILALITGFPCPSK